MTLDESLFQTKFRFSALHGVVFAPQDADGLDELALAIL